MSANRVEVQHHTPGQVATYLTVARQVCADVYGVDPYPVEVLLKAIDLIASKTVQLVQPQAIDLGSIVGGNLGRR